MAYGLRTRDNTGRIRISTIDRITRHVYTSAQTAASGNSGALSQLAGLKSGEFAVPVNANPLKTAHSVSRSGTTITWTSWSDPGAFLTPATCVMFSFVYT